MAPDNGAILSVLTVFQSRPYRAPFVLFIFRGLLTLRVLARGYDESRPYRADCRALIGRHGL